jgi:hypothetical protein
MRDGAVPGDAGNRKRPISLLLRHFEEAVIGEKGELAHRLRIFDHPSALARGGTSSACFHEKEVNFAL